MSRMSLVLAGESSALVPLSIEENDNLRRSAKKIKNGEGATWLMHGQVGSCWRLSLAKGKPLRKTSREDYDHALTGGPWLIFDHYLTVRPWEPNFHPMRASIDKVAVWVRLPSVLMEFYNKEALTKEGVTKECCSWGCRRFVGSERWGIIYGYLEGCPEAPATKKTDKGKRR
ncbi:hypothetical protein K1719_009051 [Acacia pycnantha]|nr:hypothetical protein K1719_009051 [Acacia pycnantha]